MKTCKVIGVIGAGTMGSALAQKFAQEGFNVILADREMKFVEKGLNNIKTTLDDGVSKNVFTQAEVDGFLTNIKGSANLSDLKSCDLVVEAIFENFNAKVELFKELSKIVSEDCIIATNTSSFSVTDLAKWVEQPKRFVGLHFFYHAAKNRLVEIIQGAKTSNSTFEATKRFSILSGKDPITCKDSYGFVVNRFFVPWLNEAVRLLEEKVATKEEIDTVCMNVFGIGMGPFALMNATGVPVAYHSEKTLEIFGKLYLVAPLLEEQGNSGKPWDMNTTDVPTVDAGKEKIIRERMLGVVFFVCTQILDERVCSSTELNRGAKIGLRWKRGPVDIMKKLGTDEVQKLVLQTATHYEMNVPISIGNKFWQFENVRLEKRNDVAIITMDQPENLNALSEETVNQLSNKFNDADKDPEIKTIFITGSGKSFVAGADISFFVKGIKSNHINEIEKFTQFGQDVFQRIDNSSKKVVALVNGLTLGGGLELALCADVILALPKAQFSFPETGIGIYPGLGGTQRSSRRIGKGLSKFLIYTGKMLSGAEAEEIGLVDKAITWDEAFEILAGNTPVPAIGKKNLNEKWKKISGFFENNSLGNILEKKFNDHTLSQEEAEKIAKTISFKAPIALKIADKLIEESKGCESELTHLNEIFSTSDALLGLTSIGKKVKFEGK